MAKHFSRRPLFGQLARGRFSKRSGFGEAFFGNSEFGAEDILTIPAPFGRALFGEVEFGDVEILSGIYQTRETDFGKVPVRMAMYCPRNPRTETQQAQRAKYTAGALSWAPLSEAEKEVFKLRAFGQKMSGYNLFVKEYLLSH